MFARNSACRVVCTLAIFGLGATSAGAGILDLKTGTGDTGWKIEFIDDEVQMPFFTGTPEEGRGLDGVLDLELVLFESMKPIDVRFVQMRQVTEVNFGVRVTTRFDIQNFSGKDWVRFIIEVLDSSANFVSDEPIAHPGFAHFHNLRADGPRAYPPFGPPSPANPTPTFRADRYLLSGGTFADGTTQLWSGLGIHQWERPEEDRSFILRLTPIAAPSPGSWQTLLGFAGVLFGTGWRRFGRKRIAWPHCLSFMTA